MNEASPASLYRTVNLGHLNLPLWPKCGYILVKDLKVWATQLNGYFGPAQFDAPDMWSQLSPELLYSAFPPCSGPSPPTALMHITKHFKSNPQGFPEILQSLLISDGLTGAPVSMWTVKSTKIWAFLCCSRCSGASTGLRAPLSECLTLCTTVPVITVINLNLNQSLWSGSAHSLTLVVPTLLEGTLPGGMTPWSPPSTCRPIQYFSGALERWAPSLKKLHPAHCSFHLLSEPGILAQIYHLMPKRRADWFHAIYREIRG